MQVGARGSLAFDYSGHGRRADVGLAAEPKRPMPTEHV